MATALPQAPRTAQDAAAALAAASAAGLTVRITGAGTKLGWGRPTAPADLELSTSGLNRIVEHNSGDLTATLESGVGLAQAQRAFAAQGQMLALDPPLGPDAGATIGGVVATGDCGPLRHRYGAPRDLVVGAAVALSDGTIAQSGGKVIKNVAGYDLAKLFAGSFGTLGLILAVNVRLHPLHPESVTALATAEDPDVMGAAALMLARAPLEFDACDVAWRGGRGRLLVRCRGSEATRRAQRSARLMGELGLGQIELINDDEPVWERQRAGQRSRSHDLVLMRIATPPSALASVLRAADAGAASMVGRAALGSSFVELDPDAVVAVRARLPPGAVMTLLDAPESARCEFDPWGLADGPAVALMHRLKDRFDPSQTCNPGLFVDGI